MPKTIANMTHQELERRCEELERELDSMAPLLFAEYRLVLRALRDGDPPDAPYASVKYPRAAILLCLQRNGKWMTRKQIRDDIVAGGFPIDPDTFDNLLAAALRYHTKTGKLARRDEEGNLIKHHALKLNTRFRNEQFGLAEWVKEGNFESL